MLLWTFFASSCISSFMSCFLWKSRSIIIADKCMKTSKALFCLLVMWTSPRQISFIILFICITNKEVITFVVYPNDCWYYDIFVSRGWVLDNISFWDFRASMQCTLTLVLALSWFQNRTSVSLSLDSPKQ